MQEVRRAIMGTRRKMMETPISPHLPQLRVDAALDLLRRRGMRRTTARTAILEALSITHHLTVAQLHTRLTDRGILIDLSTVHRTVDVLVELGLLHVVPTTGASTYGLADWRHHHAVCTECGQIRELPAANLDTALSALTEASDYRLSHANSGMVLYGQCAPCTSGELAALRTSGKTGHRESDSD
jgi:Fe2+ or Zn2+ uptake regulation protein